MSVMHDVVVVGAGPGGSATAHFLAQHGLDVVLLDKAEFPRDKTCGDGLTPRALGVLEEMGLMDELHRAGFRINGVELHAATGLVMAAPIPDHGEFPDYLMIVPRLTLDDILRRRSLASGAQYHSPVRVRGVEQIGDHALVRADYNGKGTTYRARVAILAIGANMRMLRRMGLLPETPRLILAARAYYEGMGGLSDNVQAHFERVPLPGYGWVFPTSPTGANVGVGFWESRIPWRNIPSSARAAMQMFMHNPKLKAMLADAEQRGPVKSYPLRIDFATAPTHQGRVLFVGETAGLVSPLTGEGIDFALESGKLAAEFINENFDRGDLSPQSLSAYDKLLRRHFQRLFVFLYRVRRMYVNPLIMDRAIAVSEKRPEVKKMVVDVMMGQQNPRDLITIPTLRKVFLGF